MEDFPVKNKKKVEKIEQKKKDIIVKVKINNFDLDMQMSTGSEVTLVPKRFLGLELYERAVYNSANLMGQP